MTTAMEIQLSRGLVATVSIEDYQRVSAHDWHAIDGNNGEQYAARNVLLPSGRKSCQHLQRFILEAKPGEVVDHRDGNGLNNVRGNLRRCVHAQNCRNRKLNRTPKTSRYKGVTWSASSRKWRAQVGRTYVGLFAAEIDAALAYDAVARKRFGEFACLNFAVTGERSCTVAS